MSRVACVTNSVATLETLHFLSGQSISQCIHVYVVLPDTSRTTLAGMY